MRAVCGGCRLPCIAAFARHQVRYVPPSPLLSATPCPSRSNKRYEREDDPSAEPRDAAQLKVCVWGGELGTHGAQARRIRPRLTGCDHFYDVTVNLTTDTAICGTQGRDTVLRVSSGRNRAELLQMPGPPMSELGKRLSGTPDSLPAKATALHSRARRRAPGQANEVVARFSQPAAGWQWPGGEQFRRRRRPDSLSAAAGRWGLDQLPAPQRRLGGHCSQVGGAGDRTAGDRTARASGAAARAAEAARWELLWPRSGRCVSVTTSWA